MTDQEQQMIQSLADRVNKTPLAEKDPDAERFLQQNLGGNPDALYILAQTTLVQQYALEQAQKQLGDLRAQVSAQASQQAAQPRHATSFLGNLLGRHDDPPPPQYTQQAPPPPPPAYGQPQYVPVEYAQPQYGSQYGSQSGGFLRGAMQTAAGVAAGAVAFEGIESLMHGFGGGGGYGGGRPEEIINNNYYGDSGAGERSEHRDLSDNISPDIEDRRGDSSFSDAVDRNDHNFGDSDQNAFSDTNDDSDANDSSLDDNSGDDFSSDDSSNFGDDSN